VSNSKSLRAFNHRNYRVLYPALALSNIGTWAQRIAQDWLVLQLTNSALDLGLVTGLQFAPTLIFSVYGGVLADRFDKRKLLAITNAGAGIVSLILGFLVISNTVTIAHVYVLAAALGLFNAIDGPIRASFTSELVGKGDIANAISLNSANFNAGRLIGPAVSGLLIAAFGTGPSFFINALTYVAMLIALGSLRKDELHLSDKQLTKAKFVDAFHYLGGRLDIQIVMLTVFATATFGMNYQIFNALMATQEFHKGPAEFGGLGTFLAVGSLSGALLSSRLEKHRVPRRIMLGAMIFGICLIGLALMPDYWAYSFALPFGGAIALVTLISANSYVQTTTDSHIRGRVMGIYLTIFMGGTPLFSPLIGWLAGLFGIRATIVGCGSIVAIMASVLLLVYSSRRRKRIDATGDSPTVAIDIVE
jgi:MFS family permease